MGSLDFAAANSFVSAFFGASFLNILYLKKEKCKKKDLFLNEKNIFCTQFFEIFILFINDMIYQDLETVKLLLGVAV